MKNYKQYNDQYFSRWAPVYDVFEILLADVRRDITTTIHPVGKSVLDVGTGTGSLALDLSKTAEKVIGIDLSSEMLEIAKKKNKKNNLTFLLMDASNMNYIDEEFDIVTISLGLHDMPLEIRTLVLKEVRRVLKSNGKLFILEYDLPQNDFLGTVSYHLINLLESKYYLDFIKSDFESYLSTLGFKMEKKTNYLFGYLRFITLTK
ncbi:MAG: methyltransferase domain-containing protein [Sphingobacteriales bacterium]|nr:methyltransferase domain-containing protein [Sphingobacteriales bacterium]